jgi:hypothetical protein
VQLDPPIFERPIDKEFSESFIIDRQNFRDNKRRGLADPCK